MRVTDAHNFYSAGFICNDQSVPRRVNVRSRSQHYLHCLQLNAPGWCCLDLTNYGYWAREITPANFARPLLHRLWSPAYGCFSSRIKKPTHTPKVWLKVYLLQGTHPNSIPVIRISAPRIPSSRTCGLIR